MSAPRARSGRLRRAQLQRSPVCERCGSAEGVQVDHVARLADGGADDLSNTQTLCEACHRLKTAAEQRTRDLPPDEDRWRALIDEMRPERVCSQVSDLRR